MTPDHHAILGPVPEVEGFFLANGFSGHGVMHAPATGKVVSDLILRGDTDLIDSRALGSSAFRPVSYCTKPRCSEKHGFEGARLQPVPYWSLLRQGF